MFARSILALSRPIAQRQVAASVVPATAALGLRGFKFSASQLQQPIDKNVQESLSNTQQATETIPDLTPLKFEKELYATLRIHNRPYLVTEGDEVTLPYRMNHAEVGDILSFNDVTTIGTKNYTYHADPIDTSVVTVKGVITEKTKKPMYTKEVTKRRNRKVRHTKVKHDLTVLRITELKLNL